MKKVRQREKNYKISPIYGIKKKKRKERRKEERKGRKEGTKERRKANSGNWRD